MNEGYTKEYEPSGGAGREVCLKTGQWINVWEIPDILKNEQALRDVMTFRQFQRLGWPYGPWGNHPAPYVELISAMQVVEEKYHPRVTLV